MDRREALQDLVACNRAGWFAIRHRDGWWVGTDEGVTCYAEHELASAAMTILWLREGGRRLDYWVTRFPGESVKLAGDHTPKHSLEEALALYEL